MNTPEALPFPFDPSRPLRQANLQRARSIYNSALKQAERIAKSEYGGSPAAEVPTQWHSALDLCIIAVQPLNPGLKLMSPLKMQSWVSALNGQLGNFASSREAQIPGGILYNNMNIHFGRRSSQMIFDNGLISDWGAICKRSKDQRPRLLLSHLVSRFCTTLLVAQSFYNHTGFTGDAVLQVSLENLGDHAVDPLVNNGWGMHDYDIALLEDWRWQYLIGEAEIKEPTQLSVFALQVIEDLCWGLGHRGVTTQNISALAQSWGFTSPKSESETST